MRVLHDVHTFRETTAVAAACVCKDLLTFPIRSLGWVPRKPHAEGCGHVRIFPFLFLAKC